MGQCVLCAVSANTEHYWRLAVWIMHTYTHHSCHTTRYIRLTDKRRVASKHTLFLRVLSTYSRTCEKIKYILYVLYVGDTKTILYIFEY